MARFSAEDAYQKPIESEDELTLYSDEDFDSDEEWLNFEETIDPAEDTETNVAESYTPALAPLKRKRGRCSVFSAIENHKESDESTQTPKRAKTTKPVRQSTLSVPDVIPQPLRFRPAQQTGLASADSHTPMSLFKHFFPESAVSTLCHNTNAQAAKATAHGRKYKWKDVSTVEMYRYIGLVFYMAQLKLSSIADYWRQNSIFTVSFPATVMSRDRYRTISWNVHMSHPDADKENDRKRGTAGHDPLFRIKPLMDTIRQACKSIHPSQSRLAVDEGMVASQSDTGLKQYMIAKPTKWGFKLFVLADSSSGYTVDFSVYTGTDSTPTGLSKDTGTSPLDHTFSNQLLQYYTAQHKTMKWYRKMFFHFLDIAATNAFIVHKDKFGTLSHKEFMEQLASELCGVAEEVAPKQTGVDHMPVPGAELSSDPRSVATTGRRNCVQCKAVHKKKQLTPWKCQACDVHLCVQLQRNCFQEWHKHL